jgi:hypothetical protein
VLFTKNKALISAVENSNFSGLLLLLEVSLVLITIFAAEEEKLMKICLLIFSNINI